VLSRQVGSSCGSDAPPTRMAPDRQPPAKMQGDKIPQTPVDLPTSFTVSHFWHPFLLPQSFGPLCGAGTDVDYKSLFLHRTPRALLVLLFFFVSWTAGLLTGARDCL